MRRNWKMCGAAALLFMVCGLALAQSADSADADKKHLKRVCGGCHSLDMVTTHKQTREAWRATIQKMIDKGLDAPEEDLEWALSYLSANYGPGQGGAAFAKLNINKATPEQLESTLGLAKADAEALVKFRKANGPFTNLQDVKKAPGVDVRKLEANKDRIEF